MKIDEIGYRKILDVVSNFNYERVHDVMKKLDWRWASSNGVPSIMDMIGLSKRIMEESIIEESNISTGGFQAVFLKYGDGTYDIGLSFEVESYYSSDEVIEENMK